MVVLGLLLGLVGTDIYTGTPRFTLGIREYAGRAELRRGRGRRFRHRRDPAQPRKRARPLGADGQESAACCRRGEDFKRMVAPDSARHRASARCSASCPAAAPSSRPSPPTRSKSASPKHPEEFGNGAIEGVAGPESANNAGAQTSFIPLLTLGIPANPVMALMIGAMIIQGIVPGPMSRPSSPRSFWGIIASMWIGNLMLVVLNLPLIGLWVKLLTIPYYVLFPIIMAVLLHRRLQRQLERLRPLSRRLLRPRRLRADRSCACEPAPLLLGFVLGPLLEENLRRAMILSRGDPTTFVTRPISASLLI